MAMDHKFIFRTPAGEVRGAAGSLEALRPLLPVGVVGGVRRVKAEGTPLEEKARQVLQEFREFVLAKVGRYRPTALSRAGLELALVKCYLKGLSIDEAAAYLANVSGTEPSHSAVGRYFKRLRDMGVAPAKEIISVEAPTV